MIDMTRMPMTITAMLSMRNAETENSSEIKGVDANG